MDLYLTDVVVEANGPVLLFGYGPEKDGDVQMIRASVSGFRPYFTLLLDATPDQVEALQAIDWSAKVSEPKHKRTVKFITAPRLNRFECDINGDRLTWPAMRVQCSSANGWKAMVATKAGIIDDIQSLLDEYGVGIHGDRNDGVREFTDGRACDTQAGSGLSFLAHQFLRCAGIKVCSWIHLAKHCPHKDALKRADVMARFSPVQANFADVSPSPRTTQPRFPLAAWDIETVNTLNFSLSKDTFPLTSDILKVEKEKENGKDNYRITVGTACGQYVRFTLPGVERAGSQSKDRKKVPLTQVTYNDQLNGGGRSERVVTVSPGDSFVVFVKKSLKLAVKTTGNMRADLVKHAKHELVYYLRQHDDAYQRACTEALGQMLRIIYQGKRAVVWATPPPGEDGALPAQRIYDTGTADVPAPPAIGEKWTVRLEIFLGQGTTCPNYARRLGLEWDNAASSLAYTETLRYNGVPTPGELPNEIIAISWDEVLYPCMTSRRRVITSCAHPVTFSDDIEGIACRNERQLLETFAAIQQASKALMVFGYNTHGYDTAYVLQRAQRLMSKAEVQDLYRQATSVSTCTGPQETLECNTPRKTQAESSGMGQMEHWTVTSESRFDVDLLAWFKKNDFRPKTKEGNQVSLKLDGVAEFFLGQRKLDIAFAEVNTRWFDPAAAAFRGHVCNYCVQDSHLVTLLACCDKVNLVEFNLRLANVMNVLPRLMPMTSGGQTSRLIQYLQHAAFDRGIVFDHPLEVMIEIASNDDTKKYEGGMVLEPLFGEHGRWSKRLQRYCFAHAVFVLDFKSLYPSVMRAFNLCYHSRIVPGFIVEHDCDTNTRVTVVMDIVDLDLVPRAATTHAPAAQPTEDTLYARLGVVADATSTAIRKAYHQLSREHHPDKGGDEEIFKRILEAYQILVNEETREEYDRTGKSDWTYDRKSNLGDDGDDDDDDDQKSNVDQYHYTETGGVNFATVGGRLQSGVGIVLDNGSIIDMTARAESPPVDRRGMRWMNVKTAHTGRWGWVYCVVPESVEVIVSEPNNVMQVNVTRRADSAKPSSVGILPDRLTKVNDLRAEVRRNAKTLPPELQASANAEQLAIKVVANSIYGAIATKYMNPSTDTAAAVTYNSRRMLLLAKAGAEAEGMEVVYGDTDSVMPKLKVATRRRHVHHLLHTAGLVPPAFQDVEAPPADQEWLDTYEDWYDTDEEAEKAWECVRDGIYEIITRHAARQTESFPAPNELEFENIFLKSEFFEGLRKNYVALATEGPGCKQAMYFKGLACVKSDCIGISREVQRILYMTKCNPKELEKKFDVVLNADPFVTCRDLIKQLMRPLTRPQCNEEFYSWCADMLTQRKRYKRESSYKNPDTLPHVCAHRMVEALNPADACAIGDMQPFIICKAKRACEGAYDPRLFQEQCMAKQLDREYYVLAAWKGMKGEVAASVRRGARLLPGAMNENTYLQLKWLFQDILTTCRGQKTLESLLGRRETSSRNDRIEYAQKKRRKKPPKQPTAGSHHTLTDFFKKQKVITARAFFYDKCHYDVLGVARDADLAQIQNAYQEKRGTGTAGAQQCVQEAFQTLSNADSRVRYDRVLATTTEFLAMDAPQLRLACAARRLDPGGTDHELVARLIEHASLSHS